MISIEQLKSYYKNDMVFITYHTAERCRQRGITAKDIKQVVASGEIIEQYPDDFPFPSCLICGKDMSGKIAHVCMSDEGSASRVITAYYPDKNKWDESFKKRKEIDNEVLNV